MIHPTAIIYPNVTIGEDVYIGPYCVIGAPAEHLKHWGEPDQKSVVIQSGTIIHGHVTIDAGIHGDTYIYSKCFIMKGVHIGHDSEIGSKCVIAPRAIIGGHVKMSPECKIGMGAIIHQRKVVPMNIEIGMGAVVTKSTELWKDGTFVGNPAHFLKPRT